MFSSQNLMPVCDISVEVWIAAPIQVKDLDAN